MSTIHGIGNVKAINSFNKGSVPPNLGTIDADKHSLTHEATRFIGHCYGTDIQGSMSDVRFNIWKTKTGQSKSKTFRLLNLPQTLLVYMCDVHICKHVCGNQHLIQTLLAWILLNMDGK